MNRLPWVFVFLLLVGCESEQPDPRDRGSTTQPALSNDRIVASPGRVERRQSAAVIDDDPILEPLIGEWVQEGSEKLVKFVRNPDKSVTVIHPYPIDQWDSVVDNVRIIDGKLHYDVYHYYTGPDSFALTETGDHPYSGQINEISAWPGDNENVLMIGFSGIEMLLKRSR